MAAEQGEVAGADGLLDHLGLIRGGALDSERNLQETDMVQNGCKCKQANAADISSFFSNFK